MFYTYYLSPTDQKCAESSMYWQFFYYHSPGKFRYTAGEIVKMSPSRFDKAPQIGNVTLIQGTIFRFRLSLPIEGDFSKRDQNCISVSGLICLVDSIQCVRSDRIHFQITFHLIIFNNSIILPVGQVTGETHWWITAQKLSYGHITQW